MLKRICRALAVLASATAVGAALGTGSAGPASAAAPPVRPAATPSCGATCASYFVQEYGPGLVLNDFSARQAVGTPVSLRPASNSRPEQDWTIWPAGTVRQLAALGLVSRKLDLHYAADQAFEVQFAPYGAGTGRCAGLAKTAAGGEPVTLQWCGRAARTIWIADSADQDGAFTPLINGSDADFSDPQVLTERGSPAGRPALVSFRLQKFAGGTVYDDQMWDDTIGVLP